MSKAAATAAAATAAADESAAAAETPVLGPERWLQRQMHADMTRIRGDHKRT